MPWLYSQEKTMMSARATSSGHPEFGSCLPRNKLRTSSNSLLLTVGCQQGYFTYPDSNNYREAIIFGHYSRVSAIS